MRAVRSGNLQCTTPRACGRGCLLNGSAVTSLCQGKRVHTKVAPDRTCSEGTLPKPAQMCLGLGKEKDGDNVIEEPKLHPNTQAATSQGVLARQLCKWAMPTLRFVEARWQVGSPGTLAERIKAC